MSGNGLDVALGARRPIPLEAAFRVEAGELLALVGPSGSGKTTVLRAIAGLHRPEWGRIQRAGTVWLDTERGMNLTPQVRRVGMVFQDYALFPHLSVIDNVAIAMDMPGREVRRQRAGALLRRVRLGGMEQRKPATLSGGQRQRVALARALARDPDVLLLDEPFSAVDMMTRQRLRRELAMLRRDIQVPMILVTHDLDEAVALADRICVLDGGRTLQTAPPDVLFRKPVTPRVVRLLGQRNVFSATVQCRGDGDWLVWGSVNLQLGRHTGIPPGTSVHWYIPDSDIVLHRRGRPSRGERENPVAGVVSACVPLGAYTAVTLDCQDVEASLDLTVSTHAAQRNGLVPGVRASVSLLAEGIHVMRSEEAVRR